MATNSYIPMNFLTVCGKAFIFDEVQTVKNANLDTDSFKMSTLPAERSWIRSKDNKFVFINFEEKKFEAQTMNAVQRRKPECQFEFQLYKENNLDTFKRAVIVYYCPANSGAKPMVACCNEDNRIHAEEMAFQRIWQYIQPASQPQTTCNHTCPGPPHPACSPPRSCETSHSDSCWNNRSHLYSMQSAHFPHLVFPTHLFTCSPFPH
ncbi:uncharacterized protein LOC109138612 isoform X1 [Larimichthys crocea]|uniref:uncharacterized protein LOC109138612 isoform X1 n=1 Tax=Larimichthys crocea TaxID=215358 RepID=UPI000F5D715F|nr:uncharacterized protein LOC109138612 isoform X1 [Larimichthys crocea]